MTRLLAN